MLLLGETSITPKLQDNNEDDVFWRLAKDIGKAKAKFQTLGYTLIVEPLYFNCTRGKKKKIDRSALSRGVWQPQRYDNLIIKDPVRFQTSCRLDTSLGWCLMLYINIHMDNVSTRTQYNNPSISIGLTGGKGLDVDSQYERLYRIITKPYGRTKRVCINGCRHGDHEKAHVQ